MTSCASGFCETRERLCFLFKPALLFCFSFSGLSVLWSPCCFCLPGPCYSVAPGAEGRGFPPFVLLQCQKVALMSQLGGTTGRAVRCRTDALSLLFSEEHLVPQSPRGSFWGSLCDTLSPFPRGLAVLGLCVSAWVIALNFDHIFRILDIRVYVAV